MKVLQALFIFLSWPSISLAAISSTVGLSDSYRSALEKHETIPIEIQKVKAAEEREKQAFRSVFPTLEASANYTRQDPPNTIAPNANLSSARLTLTQPLFRGLGEYAGMSATAALHEAQKLSLEQAKLDLYSDTVKAFYEVLSADQDQKNLDHLVELTSKRVTELSNRNRIGRSRKGEVLAAQAQLASLQAQLFENKALARAARVRFSELTGLERTVDLKDTEIVLPKDAVAIDPFIKKGAERPEVLAGQYRMQAAKQEVRIARSGHFPSLDGTANYYFKRNGALSDSKWDIGVTWTVPLFQGGVVQSQVNEASARAREREFDLDKTKRDVRTEIETLFEQLLGSMAQFRSLEEALRISEANFVEQQKDYRFGLITHLEVLQSLNIFQETKRSLDRAGFQAKSLLAQLNAASGTIPGSEKP